MTVSYRYLNDPILQFWNNGEPVAGGKLFTYVAGTDTKLNTFSDNSGTLMANPIILDSQGRVTSSGGVTISPIFGQVGQSYKLVLAPSTDSDPPTSPIWTADNQALGNNTTLIDPTNNDPVIVAATPMAGTPVNYIIVTNAATGNPPNIAAGGTDADIDLEIEGKGTGAVKLGTANLAVPNADGTAGQVLKTNGSGTLGFQTMSWEKISSQTASSSASIAFTDLSTTYLAYLVVYSAVLPATDGTVLFFRTSTNNGSSYDSGATDYKWANTMVNDSAAVTNTADLNDDGIRITNAQGNAATRQVNGTIAIYLANGTQYTSLVIDNTYTDNSGNNVRLSGFGKRVSTTAVDAIQILYISGNIASGTFTLYGLRN